MNIVAYARIMERSLRSSSTVSPRWDFRVPHCSLPDLHIRPLKLQHLQSIGLPRSSLPPMPRLTSGSFILRKLARFLAIGFSLSTSYLCPISLTRTEVRSAMRLASGLQEATLLCKLRLRCISRLTISDNAALAPESTATQGAWLLGRPLSREETHCQKVVPQGRRAWPPCFPSG